MNILIGKITLIIDRAKVNDKLPELYIAVDVEADGPIPGDYSMISLGMSVVGQPELTFILILLVIFKSNSTAIYYIPVFAICPGFIHSNHHLIFMNSASALSFFSNSSSNSIPELIKLFFDGLISVLILFNFFKSINAETALHP